MGQEQGGFRIGLRTKLNFILIACILLVSVGLMMITYRVYCRKVDSFHFDQARRAVNAAAEDYTACSYVEHLWNAINTDEFRAVRERALAAKDEQIIRDWMLEKPSASYAQRDSSDGTAPDGGKEEYLYDESDTLLSDYQFVAILLARIKELFEITSVYIQYDDGGVTYTLVDPDESLLVIGEVEEPIAALSQYVGNVRIPPTVCQYRGNWLCTACEPIVEVRDREEHVVGIAGVDIDMNNVVRERHGFLINSAMLITALTLAAIFISMVLIRKLATDPLRLLAKGATGFAKGDEGYTKDDVIQLPIRSNDEIGDLYHEIQSMQTRIVDYTNSLTRITAERERANAQLRMAAQIQSAILPNQFPPFPEVTAFDLFATMHPAKLVGGDFYDFVMIDDDHLAMVIADVSDKGVPAALFMMSAKIIINYRVQMGGTPAEILMDANAQLCNENDAGMFVTVWLGVLELSTGRLTCSNAGHEYPIIRGQDGAFRVYQDRHGLMVGAMESTKYSDYEILLAPGDAVFVYTDGVSEANNAAGEFYGLERLEATLNRVGGADPREILAGVKADVDAFANGADQFDDMTMLCMVYRGGEQPDAKAPERGP